MSNSKTLYETLGVSKQAGSAEIKAAYRKKVRKAHPDRGGTPEECAEINHAYAVLGDSAKRLRYDTTGDSSIQPEVPEESRMRGDIVTLFMKALNRLGPEHDLLAAIRDELQNEEVKIKSHASELGHLIARLESAKDRLSRKRKGDDFLSQYVSEQQKALQGELKKAYEQAAYVRRLKKRLNDWDYRADIAVAEAWRPSYVRVSI